MIESKILFWYWGRKGGGAKYSQILFENLRGSEISCRIVPSFSRNSDFFDKKTDLQLNFNITTYTNLIGFILNSLFLPVLIIRFFLFLKINKVKTVLCPMSHIWNVVFIPFFSLLNIRYVFVAHDGEAHPGDDILFRSFLLRYEILKANQLITLTSSVKDLIESKYNTVGEIKIIPHGVFDYGQKKCQIVNKDRIILLFFGRITKYKGVDQLIKYFSKLEKKEKYYLKIFGSGKLENDSLDLIRKNNNITLVQRWIEESEIPKIICSSDIVVLPYIEASQSGVVPIALCSGIPILSSRLKGLEEQLKNGELGCFYDVESFSSFERSLEELSGNEEYYSRLSKQGQDFAADELSWNSISKKFIDVLE